MATKHAKLQAESDFSIVLGGPLYQFYLRSRLATPPLNLCKRRTVVICLFTWLPLLVLSLIGDVAIDNVKIPFIEDIDTHVRFIAALGLLIAAELVAHQRLGNIIVQFLDRQIVAEENRAAFDKHLISAIKLRNSVIIELILIALVYSGGHFLWKEFAYIDISTWYASVKQGVANLTMAGYWYVFISLPIFQFILLRWYFRIFVWYRLLWNIARMPLHLNSLHPDRAGGLGFLVNSILAFLPFVLAHTVLMSGIIMNHIWHDGAKLLDFKLEVFCNIFLLVVIVILPLVFFAGQMISARWRGTNQYGSFASHYVNQFYYKWVNGKNNDGDKFLGSQDIQALADLSGSFEVTHNMGIVPFKLNNIVQIIVIAAIPFLPLILTMVPLAKVAKRLIEILL